jgi:diaminohydroxyphosphoribosylaminopyrimidine deaminase/5-amino-6-(5-phosphoribosylamino)uracil reductase
VHIAVPDPSPVAGGGAAVLEAAGIAVGWGNNAEQAEALYRAHRKHAITGLPWVIAKFAASLDGKIATASGESKWITGSEAREEAHHLRSQVDAVIVGAGTVAIDDPLLTARPHSRLWRRQPLRVVVGGSARLSPDAQVFQQEGESLLVTRENLPSEALERWHERDVTTVAVPEQRGKVDLLAMLRFLGQRPVTSVLVEGGSALLGSFFDERLVDEVYAFLAPMIIGGAAAVPAVGGVGVASMADAMRLREIEVRRLGQDVLVHGRLVWEE